MKIYPCLWVYYSRIFAAYSSQNLNLDMIHFKIAFYFPLKPDKKGRAYISLALPGDAEYPLTLTQSRAIKQIVKSTHRRKIINKGKVHYKQIKMMVVENDRFYYH